MGGRLSIPGSFIFLSSPWELTGRCWWNYRFPMAVKYVASTDLKSSSLLPAISRTLEFIYTFTESLGFLCNLPEIDITTIVIILFLRLQNPLKVLFRSDQPSVPCLANLFIYFHFFFYKSLHKCCMLHVLTLFREKFFP